MTYFYIICLYLKLKLRNDNNHIRNSFNNKLIKTYNKMKNILKSLDSIGREINTYKNDLMWYLMIVLMSVILILDFVLF
jgi:hypothetical protein